DAGTHRALHSFPTRRSSDLDDGPAGRGAVHGRAVDEDVAPRGGVEARHHVEQCGLAAAARPQDGGELVALHREVDGLRCLYLVAALVELLEDGVERDRWLSPEPPASATGAPAATGRR